MTRSGLPKWLRGGGNGASGALQSRSGVGA